MKFIPFIDKTKAVDFTAATTLARRLNDDFKVSPAPPQYTVKSLIAALSAALGLFGISVYVVNRVGQMRNEIHAEMDQIRRERHGYDTTRSTEA